MVQDEISNILLRINELETKTAELAKRTDSLNKQINGNPEDEQFKGLRFQNDGNWAIHYSTVRMTIATFVITTCIAITGFQWEDRTTPILFSVATIGILGLFLFYAFTYFTMKMMRNQGEWIGKTDSIKAYWKRDIASYIIALFAVAYWYVACFMWAPQ